MTTSDTSTVHFTKPFAEHNICSREAYCVAQGGIGNFSEVLQIADCNKDSPFQSQSDLVQILSHVDL